MATEPGRTEDLTPVIELVDTLCDRFERAWRDGATPALAEFLPADGPVRPAALVPLVLIDLEYRLRGGEAPRAESYLDHFPELRADPARALAVVAHEWKVRRVREPALAPDEYRRRFPSLMAHPDWDHLFPAERGTDSDGSQVTTPPVPTAPVPAGPWPAVPGYELLEELGRGGMGVVYKARQVKARRLVALKMILAARHGSLADRVRFQIEAEAVARLQHPNIVQLHEVGEVEGRPFFSLEFCGGGGLDRRLKAGPLPPREAAALVEKIARAMHAAHLRGVVHRDLKPANVLLTADGEPKVSDFGLAKRLDAASELSQTGQLMGTPAYMAPEQAAGRVRDIGPLTDVYALGAVLYALVAGQPPFRGESLEEMLEQVRAREPEPLSRSRPGLPRDLETICLKCLAKEPARRYASAEALADDLRRFLAGEPIAARRVGAAERLVKWVRRRPAAAGLLAAMLLLVLGGSVGAWLLHRWRAEATRAAEGDIQKVLALRAEERWPEALALIEQTHQRLAGSGLADLARRVERLRADLLMVVRLEDIRLQAAEVKDDHFDTESKEPAYRRAFREYGLDAEELDPSVAAERVRASEIKDQLVTGLEGWADSVSTAAARERILAVARLTDSDPWRQEFWDALARQDPRALERLAARREVADLPPVTLLLLAEGLEQVNGVPAAVKFLEEAQRRHPADFWMNHTLAARLRRLKPPRTERAIGFYRAALALRPRSPGAHYNLGLALHDRGDLDGAVAAYRKAVELKPDYAAAHFNLGNALHDRGDLDGAMAAYRKAIEHKPDYAKAYNNFGNALADLKKPGEAAAAFRKAIALKPDFAEAHSNLGVALRHSGQSDEAVRHLRRAVELEPKNAAFLHNLGLALLARKEVDEAIRCFRKAIELDPADAWPHNGLGRALERKGQVDEAIGHYREAVALDPDFAKARFNLGYALREKGQPGEAVRHLRRAAELEPTNADYLHNLGLALLATKEVDEAIRSFRRAIELDPDDARPHNGLGWALEREGRIDEAIDHYRKAVARDPEFVKALSNLGSALREKGQLDEAIRCYEKVIRLEPENAEAHCNLGNARREQGQFEAALAALRRGHELGSKKPRWRYPSARWVGEVERLIQIDAKLSAILKGDARAADAAERLELAGLCRNYKRRYAAAARFYAEAFADKPATAADLEAGHRYDAACASALAGCGRGIDAAALDARERIRLRAQALDWLRADLTKWGERLEGGPPARVAEVREQLLEWQKDADLAGVRHPWSLLCLPADERRPWQQLWADVAALLRRAAA